MIHAFLCYSIAIADLPGNGKLLSCTRGFVKPAANFILSYRLHVQELESHYIEEGAIVPA